MTVLERRSDALARRRPRRRRRDARRSVEHTLTDGYARALALEAERLRGSSAGSARSPPTRGDARRRRRRDELAGSRAGSRRRREAISAGCAPSLDARCATGRARSGRAAAAQRVLDDPAADRVDGRLDAVLDLELHQDVRDVVLDRLRADVQLARRSRRCPCRSRSASAPRSRGRRARCGSSRRRRAGRSVARTRCSTFAAMWGEISDSPTAAARMPAHQLLDRRVLEQVAAGAGEDRVHHVAVLVGDRQHDHARERRHRP